jgi:hypothetical protein
MKKLPKFPKGEIKKNKYFIFWVLAAAFVILMGVTTVISKEFSIKQSPPITGDFAVIIGIFFIAFGAYFIFYLYFRAEKEEKLHLEYHDLENFEDYIDEYKVKFSVLNSSVVIGNTTRPAYYYILEIELKKNLLSNLHIKQRDRFEYLFWKIGLTRFLDTLTGNYYFDSKYKVTCYNKERFSQIFTVEVLNLLEIFDQDYPPIRAKNGNLEIEDNLLKYCEGPYIEEHRIFDPHRGVIEKLFRELTKIISAIEKNVPEVKNEDYEKDLILIVRDQEAERKAKRDNLINTVSNIYIYTAYVVFMVTILIVLFANI